MVSDTAWDEPASSTFISGKIESENLSHKSVAGKSEETIRALPAEPLTLI
jgi:hypothetical protein